MRSFLIAAILLGVLVQQRSAAQTSDTNSSSDSQPLQDGVQYENQGGGGNPELEVTNAVISVRKDATDGIGAPQIGLDPTYPAAIDHWKEVAAKYPEQAAPYESCVQDYLQASEDIKQISPLTKRPAWDVSGAQINAALQKASQLVAAGDDCQKVAQATPLKGDASTQQQTPPLQGYASTQQQTPPLQGYASSQQQTPPLQGAADSYYPDPVEVQAPGPAQVIHVRYAVTPATNPVTYSYGGQPERQEICIMQSYPGNTPPMGPATVSLPTTGFFFTQANVYLYQNAVQVQQLVGTDGKTYAVPGGMRTLPFSNQPCGPWKSTPP